jgi:hypothetical protein
MADGQRARRKLRPDATVEAANVGWNSAAAISSRLRLLADAGKPARQNTDPRASTSKRAVVPQVAEGVDLPVEATASRSW